MEISLLNMLVNGMSSFEHLSFSGNFKSSEPILKYYQKAEEILNLLKPIIEAITNTDLASDEVLLKIFEDLWQALQELRELIESCQLLSSKFYIVLQIESLTSKIQILALNILKHLQDSHQCLLDELSSAHIEHCVEKIKNLGPEEVSSIIKEAIGEQVEDAGPGSEVLEKIADNLGLRSNQEVLIEAVALEKLKENAEQIENTRETKYVEQIIALVNHLHEHLVMLKEAQSCRPVPVPLDFCCPLSLELMTDPVIVASGQTYERAFIKNWIDLGLTVCPKTRQTLTHTNLIPNYTVKALIANWCELNNVELVDPIMSLNQASSLHSTGNLPLSTDSVHDSHFNSADKSLTPSGTQQEESSPLHPLSTSEGSLSGMTNGQGLDIARMSQTSSDSMSASLDERGVDLVRQDSTSPCGRESSSAFSSEQSQTHVRTDSDSIALSGENFPQGTQGDGFGASQPLENSGDNGDASGEVTPRSDTTGAATLNALQREPEFSTPLIEARPRILSIWQQPLERLRVASSTVVESRSDLSSIETSVQNLVEDLKSSSLDTQREATAELRLLAKHNMDNRIAIANCGVISLLVGLLLSTDAKIQENAVTALLNLSINDNNKMAIANAGAIDSLIHVLETGNPEAKENSAAALYSLSMMEENRIRIGRSGAIKPLVDLLANGTPRGKKDASTALFNLSIFHENKGRIVQEGAVKHLVELMDPAAGMVDKAVAVLANLATIPEGRTAIGHEGGIPFLVEVIELGSARGKENAAAALLHLCSNSPRILSIVIHEGAIPPLVALSLSGTPRAKEKAQALLNHCRSHRQANVIRT